MSPEWPLAAKATSLKRFPLYRVQDSAGFLMDYYATQTSLGALVLSLNVTNGRVSEEDAVNCHGKLPALNHY